MPGVARVPCFDGAPVNLFPPVRFQSVDEALAAIPEGFVSDGLSGGFPDWLFAPWDLTEIDWPHAHAYCTRCWPAGSRTRRAQKLADRQLKAHANERLPWWFPLTPIVLWAGVWVGGHGSFDTCYAIDPLDATDEQLAAGLCRHAMPRPQWMVEQLERR